MADSSGTSLGKMLTEAERKRKAIGEVAEFSRANFHVTVSARSARISELDADTPSTHGKESKVKLRDLYPLPRRLQRTGSNGAQMNRGAPCRLTSRSTERRNAKRFDSLRCAPASVN